ncbi:gamma-glutamyltransferase, partial [Stenotrophomonas maltophilia]|uniref:gamma-glutamyltransferase n=1 Tax=Stenotrophomonas maltophilia TaxID=40324 RepID=UPI001953DE12
FALDQPEAATTRTARQASLTAPAKRFAATAANPLAAAAGVEMLGAGGSALDAAIAMQAVLGLVEPQSSGIAGGAFLVHW